MNTGSDSVHTLASTHTGTVLAMADNGRVSGWVSGRDAKRYN